MAKIFSSTNNFSALQTQAGGSVAAQREGICAALTGLWCMHMLEGKRDLLTKPSYERAQALQVQYRWKWDSNSSRTDNEVMFLKRIGVQGTLAFRRSATNIALSQIAAKPGIYCLRNDEHAVGAAILNNRYYFYDCDENGAGGLYAFDSADDWRGLVNQHYTGDALQGISTAL